MEAVLDYPPATVVPAPPPARPGHAARPNWLWWLFLLGVAAFGCAGPTCAWH